VHWKKKEEEDRGRRNKKKIKKKMKGKRKGKIEKMRKKWRKWGKLMEIFCRKFWKLIWG